MAARRKPQPDYSRAGANRVRVTAARRLVEQQRLDAAVAVLTAADATKLGDAPNDGNFYARKGGAYVRIALNVLPAT